MFCAAHPESEALSVLSFRSIGIRPRPSRLRAAYRIGRWECILKTFVQLIMHFLVGLLRLFRIFGMLIFRRWVELLPHSRPPLLGRPTHPWSTRFLECELGQWSDDSHSGSLPAWIYLLQQ